MSTILREPTAENRRRDMSGQPAWDVALLFPTQGNWSEDEYLALDSKRLVELSSGFLEVLPMASLFHQLVVQFLYEALVAHVRPRALGLVVMAPLPIRLFAGTYREPDVVFLRPGRIRDVHSQPEGADLVIEVVSEGEENRRRDLVIKREEYARAGITEYWIVDPQEKSLIVLALEGTTYRVAGEYRPGSQAVSVLLPGLQVEVDAVLAAGIQAS